MAVNVLSVTWSKSELSIQVLWVVMICRCVIPYLSKKRGAIIFKDQAGQEE